MTVLMILGILIGVAGIGWSCMAVHEYAKQHYAYNVGLARIAGRRSGAPAGRFADGASSGSA